MTDDPPSHEFVRLLSIAGSDSGGGAGVQADLKTFAALGCYGMTAITALTAQNTRGVSAIYAASTEFLETQIDAVMSDIGADAVKIGMLHSAEIIRVVAGAIDRYKMRRAVLDPVMVSATGAVLIEPEAGRALAAELFPRTTIITPNLDEASLLLGKPIRGVDEMPAAAEALLRQGARAALLKGGHLAGDVITDVLAISGRPPLSFSADRIVTKNLHGAGCTLSSAIAAYLALGEPLIEAVEAARQFVREALRASADVATGRGVGPLNHGVNPLKMRTRPRKPASP